MQKAASAFKSFIGPVSPDYVPLTIGQAREAMEILREFDARAGFHCEDYSLIKWGEERAKRKAKPDWQDSWIHARSLQNSSQRRISSNVPEKLVLKCISAMSAIRRSLRQSRKHNSMAWMSRQRPVGTI